MDEVLRNLTGKECWVFIDDVAVFADTIGHACRLEHVLQCSRKQIYNCSHGNAYLCKQVKYLGYVVSQDGITAPLDKVKAVQQYLVPKNAKDVRSFLGLVLFYRHLVHKFAEIAKPLTELIRKDASKQLLRS
jgi:hypothetical protein